MTVGQLVETHTPLTVTVTVTVTLTLTVTLPLTLILTLTLTLTLTPNASHNPAQVVVLSEGAGYMCGDLTRPPYIKGRGSV